MRTPLDRPMYSFAEVLADGVSYSQTGPPTNFDLPRKSWVDSIQHDALLANPRTAGVLVTYNLPVIDRTAPEATAIMLQPYTMTRKQAATANLPPAGSGDTDPAVIQWLDNFGEIQPPLQALVADEYLAFDQMGNPCIKRRTLLNEIGVAQAGDGFTVSDRALLQRIAAKLRV